MEVSDWHDVEDKIITEVKELRNQEKYTSSDRFWEKLFKLRILYSSKLSIQYEKKLKNFLHAKT